MNAQLHDRLRPFALVALTLAFFARSARADEPTPASTSDAPSPPPPPPPVRFVPPSPAPTSAPIAARNDADASGQDDGASSSAELGSHRRNAMGHDKLRLSLGMRASWAPDDAFDTFGDTNSLGQVSIDATYTFLSRENLALAAGLGYDFGGRSHDTRGIPASLAIHRVSVPLEARLGLTRRLYVFGRVAPALNVLEAEVSKGGNRLVGTSVAFATDLSVGASLALADAPRKGKRYARAWLTGDLGYGLAFATALRPQRDREPGERLGTDEPLDLGSLSLGGPFFRLGFNVSY